MRPTRLTSALWHTRAAVRDSAKGVMNHCLQNLLYLCNTRAAHNERGGLRRINSGKGKRTKWHAVGFCLQANVTYVTGIMMIDINLPAFAAFVCS